MDSCQIQDQSLCIDCKLLLRFQTNILPSPSGYLKYHTVMNLSTEPQGVTIPEASLHSFYHKNLKPYTAQRQVSR
jgi:hypothetical protein